MAAGQYRSLAALWIGEDLCQPTNCVLAARGDTVGKAIGDPRLQTYTGYTAGWVEASRQSRSGDCPMPGSYRRDDGQLTLSGWGEETAHAVFVSCYPALDAVDLNDETAVKAAVRQERRQVQISQATIEQPGYRDRPPREAADRDADDVGQHAREGDRPQSLEAHAHPAEAALSLPSAWRGRLMM